MKNLVAISVLMICGFSFNDDLVRIRDAYAAKSKKSLQSLKQLLKSSSAANIPVLQCYRGAAEMMEARYAINPFNKFSAFSKGKQLIEQALASNSAGVECHFIRYGIQRNLPAILNYRDQIPVDSVSIIKALDTLRDGDLKKRIVAYLKKY